MIAVVAIYSHPELYPPTLNAIEVLSSKFDKTYVICNNVVSTNWSYPTNVELVAIGSYVHIRLFEKKSILWKIQNFWTFMQTLKKYVRDASLILTYDSIALLSYGLSFYYLASKSPVWWYHNHDVADLSQIRIGSIGWLAVKLEPSFFHWLDLFSLPSQERKLYFPMEKLKGEYFFLPNFPSIKVYGDIPRPFPPKEELKLIYQGSISPGHGIEAILLILGEKGTVTVTLTLIGNISEKYKEELENLAVKNNTKACLIIKPSVSYKILPSITNQHHIGLAIHEPKGMIYATGGTASNKIYEYAACGLPILYLNTPHYISYLQKYFWAIPINLESKSIQNSLESIFNEYDQLSLLAKQDFLEFNNFESIFVLPIQNVFDKINKKSLYA